MHLRLLLAAAVSSGALVAAGQGRPISPNLFGVFFEDINYAADGGLWSELLQNGSFEYTPSDVHVGQEGWHSLTAWQLVRAKTLAALSVETEGALNERNRHYVRLTVSRPPVGLRNGGWDGIPVKAGAVYHFSAWLRSSSEVPVRVSLREGDKELARAAFNVAGDTWTRYSADLTAESAADSACLQVDFDRAAVIGFDQASLMPDDTYKGHGLRRDLAECIEQLNPHFVRFPGGCLAHGDGLDNIYNWKNTVGPVEQRLGQRNIWNYHQSVALGYHEFLQFCEDLGAEPLPVVAAGVSCQNSGGDMGEGQQAVPMDRMGDYVQDVLDLVEYCNGPATSKWGSVRAAAGHPKPFNLHYIGVGNEDRITPAFEERFAMLCRALRDRHPEIRIIGTSGPFSDGEDFDKGWQAARQAGVDVVDEHYYKAPEWFLDNLRRYDAYPRQGPKVYLGEYASWGSKWANALAEAAYMTGLERNGDVVEFASYAPLLARRGHTQWNPDLIYFDNKGVYPTVSYHVQRLFGRHSGVRYLPGVCDGASALSTSCVRTAAGAVVLKIVNTTDETLSCPIDLTRAGKVGKSAALTLLQGEREATELTPDTRPFKLAKKDTYQAPARSLSVIVIDK